MRLPPHVLSDYRADITRERKWRNYKNKSACKTGRILNVMIIMYRETIPADRELSVPMRKYCVVKRVWKSCCVMFMDVSSVNTRTGDMI